MLKGLTNKKKVPPQIPSGASSGFMNGASSKSEQLLNGKHEGGSYSTVGAN